MGYSSEWGKNADQGGPFPAVKKNPRPQSFVGKYTADGLPEMGQQKFRPELPPARDTTRDKSLLDGQYSNAGGPSFDKILKTWR
jgi:hypothetical protein